MSINWKRKKQVIRLTNLFELNKLNARFQVVSIFTKLKTFFNFFEIKQWIDEKQKFIVRQIIFVIIFLMINQWFHIVNFIRVFVNFILITQYQFHDDFILQYLNHVLSWINSFKKIFRESHSIKQKIEENYFNFLKFYVLSH